MRVSHISSIILALSLISSCLSAAMFARGCSKCLRQTQGKWWDTEQTVKKKEKQDEGVCATVSEDRAEELPESLCKGQEENKDSKHCLRPTCSRVSKVWWLGFVVNAVNSRQLCTKCVLKFSSKFPLLTCLVFFLSLGIVTVSCNYA